MSYYPPPPPRHQPGPLRTFGLVMAAVALAALIGAAFLVGGLHRAPSLRSLGPQGLGDSGQNTAQSFDTNTVAGKVAAGLVDVNTTLGYQGAQAAGTGMVLTPDGEVLTNNHVVEGATSISVTDIDTGKTYKAAVTGYDRTEDVAVLRLQGASGLATITTGDSGQVGVGEPVVGIGNAGGTGGAPSVAPGTVTALGQSITASDESSGSSEQLEGLIQVNANIQSGDSGGALADRDAHVIGMNTAASSGYQFGPGRHGQRQSQSSAATGYAIPINQALSIAKQIEAGSSSSTVHIGASAFLGVSVADSGQGAAIQEVVPGGPAAQAGLSAGDVLSGINDQQVDSATTLTTLMDGFHPGDKITLSWLDQTGQQQSATVTLAEGPVG
ncbi:S1C family serine protease [Amycolatopsis pithecellobii]|uniref:PDZ domain-containing protein n=1 Tax=Amycolatopsis pithecellobii TaxID=664692 RepID=A0A6N7Z5Z7_9PSEU|nr:trypsin-like peptidase domain-containing protein [Amycolatopsis pithecellobii]MTD57853.1 PDZ domain-containing protein [Amycolatopsis pithecellobii]